MKPLSLVTCLALAIGGCQASGTVSAPAPGRPAENLPVAVEVGTAQWGQLETPRTYSGTTLADREVLLRPQVEGVVLQLTVEAGDRVTAGQVLGRLQSDLLAADLRAAQADLTSRQAERNQADAQVRRARTQKNQAELQLRQARLDAARFAELAEAGAVAVQQAESAQTAALVAAEALRATQEDVRIAQLAVETATARYQTQRALVRQAEERLTQTQLISPLTGVVLERLTQVGNLARPGESLLRLGELTQLRVRVPVPEGARQPFRFGDSVTVTLDGFPGESLRGAVLRVPPAADPASRLIPVEIRIPNPQQRYGAGLLAKVTPEAPAGRQIAIPETALVANRREPGQSPTVFILQGPAEAPQVVARAVQVGEVVDGQVVITAGLAPGDRYVRRSDRPLKPGEPVRVSVLSDSP